METLIMMTRLEDCSLLISFWGGLRNQRFLKTKMPPFERMEKAINID